MADWIWNEANILGVTDIEIDILNDSVAPKEMQIRPIIAQLERLRETIATSLTSNDFPLDFIVDARFTINIPQAWKTQRLLLCKVTMTDKDGRLYEGKTYTEQATETRF